MIAILNLNYFRPHKNKLLFWLTQLSFLITACKYVTALVLSVAEHDKAAGADADAVEAAHQRVETIGVLLIILDVSFILSGLATVFAACCGLRRKLADTQGPNAATARMQAMAARVAAMRRVSASVQQIVPKSEDSLPANEDEADSIRADDDASARDDDHDYGADEGVGAMNFLLQVLREQVPLSLSLGALSPLALSLSPRLAATHLEPQKRGGRSRLLKRADADRGG